MVPESSAIQERCRVDDPDERLDAPPLHDRELGQPLVRQARSPQHLLVRILLHGLLPPGRHACTGIDCIHPVLEHVPKDTWPFSIALPCRAAPEKCDTATFTETGDQASRNGITVEPLEGVADRDEIEGSLERHVFGRRGNPANVRDAETPRLESAELDRL